MAQSAPARTKIPTKIPQPAQAAACRPARPKARRAARSPVFAGAAGRPASRGDGNPVIELEYGITVYPAREGQDRWRAVWYENGSRRQCEAVSGERLAARLEKVTERLAADAPNMERTGADLIAHYLDADRLPADQRWPRKHAHTQRRLCERFAAPVIGGVLCQDIKAWHMQQVVNAAPAAKEGARVHGMISALVGAGIEGGYLANPRLARVHRKAGDLANPRLAKVHRKAGDRPLPPPRVSVAGESGLWVDPAEIPSAGDVEQLGKALAAGLHGDRDQLMANTAAYSGLRWGGIAAVTVPQVDTAARVITVDRISTAIAVLAVAGVAAYESYWHAYAVIRAHGESGVTARLESATIDGLVYASSMVIMYATRHRLPVPSRPAGCSRSASSPRSRPTWPRAGPMGRSAQWSRPGRPPAWWAAMNSWSGSSVPQQEANRFAYQTRTASARRRASLAATRGSPLVRSLALGLGRDADGSSGSFPIARMVRVRWSARQKWTGQADRVRTQRTTWTIWTTRRAGSPWQLSVPPTAASPSTPRQLRPTRPACRPEVRYRSAGSRACSVRPPAGGHATASLRHLSPRSGIHSSASQARKPAGQSAQRSLYLMLLRFTS